MVARPSDRIRGWSVALLTCIALGFLTIPVVAAPGPLIVSPDSGPIGTLITLTASGFTPEGRVSIRWNSDELADQIATTNATPGGVISVQVTVPDTATPGRNLVVACEAAPGGAGQCLPDQSRGLFRVTDSPTTTQATTTTTQPTTTTSGVLVGDPTVPTLPPGHGSGTDDYTWWSSSTTTMPGYPFSGPYVPPPPDYPDFLPPELNWADVRATAIEITQGLQNLDNDMPLTSGRRTYARVYVDVVDEDSWPFVSGAIEAWRGTNYLGLIFPENGPITAYKDGGSRIRLNDSLYFKIPQAWTQGTVRFNTLVWAQGPKSIDQEDRPDNNFKSTLVDFNPARTVTVHPVPLHLHRSYHPSDVVRTYHGLFGGPVLTFSGNGDLGALDVVEGLYRYHPIANVHIEPWPEVMYPLNHNAGAEWNLGWCQTYLTGIESNYITVADHELLFKPGGAPPVSDYTEPDSVSSDYDRLFIMDRTFDISRLRYYPGPGHHGVQGALSSGDPLVLGAPVFIEGCIPADHGLPSNYGAPNYVMSLNRIWYDWDDISEFFIGMVDESLPTRFGGLAKSGYESAWVKFQSFTNFNYPWWHPGADIMGHEVGHLTGLKHVACKDTDNDGQPDELKGGAVDLSHPMVDWWPKCRLAEIDPEGFFGFDVYHHLWGLPEPVVLTNDPDEPHPNRAMPLMSYLNPGWTDPYHWCKMLEYYWVGCKPNEVGIPWNPPPPEPTDGAYGSPTGPIPFDPEVNDEVLVAFVGGTVNTETGETDLMVIELPDATFELPPWFEEEVITGETLVIEAIDVGGEVIYRVPFDQNTEDDNLEPDLKHVSARMVLMDGVHYRVKQGGEVITDLQPSNNPPVGEWLVAEAGPEGVHLEWDSSDSDGDPVYTTVQYSNDGVHWIGLSQTMGVGSYQSENVGGSLPGGQGRFRLLLNDGWHTTYLEGPAMVVEDKPPVAAILYPKPGFAFATNAPIEFEATVFDLEDRGVGSVVWSSSIDGAIGSELSMEAGLSGGNHVITLEATDSAGNTTTDTVEIFVDPDTVYQGPDDDLVATLEDLFLRLSGEAIGPDPTTTTSAGIPSPEEAPPTPIWWAAVGGLVLLGAAGLAIFRRRGTPPTPG